MTAAPAPRWLTWAAILFLLWNMMGIAAFASQWSMSAQDIAALPQIERELWASMTGWAWTAYAIAVGVAVIGSIGLILRKWWAALAYAISLIALLIQFSFPLLIAKNAAAGLSIIAFPIFIVVIGILQWQLSRHWQRKGWLT